MTTIKEVFPSDAILWLEFGGIYTDSAGNRVVDNLAERGDAPARVTCGAGAACPTQLSGRRGVSFAGAQWIDCGLTDRFERTDSFTLVSVNTCTDTVAVNALIANSDAAQSLRGMYFAIDPRAGVNYLYTGIHNNNTDNRIITRTETSTSTSFKAINSNVLVYNGASNAAGVLFYRNAALCTKVTSFDTLSATIKPGKPFLIGALHNGAGKANYFTGNMHFAAAFPLAASQLQIQNLMKRVLKRINLP